MRGSVEVSDVPEQIVGAPRHIVPRECHGLGNPRGSRVRVVAGAGAGGKFPTRDQPSPAAWVTQTHCGFFSVKVLKSSAAKSELFINSQ